MSTKFITDNLYQRLVDNSVDVRQEAMKSFRKHMTTVEDVSEEEMLKIWKGFYYCMWMSDKSRVQEEFARTLASTMHMFKPKVAMCYYDCFLQTMSREFGGIDQYRKDKYFMLIRRCVEAAFVYLRAHEWDVSIAQAMSVAHSKVFKLVTLDGRITALFLCETFFQCFAASFQKDMLFNWLVTKDPVVYSELEKPHIYIDTASSDLNPVLLKKSVEYLEPCPFESFKTLFFPLLSLLQVTGDKGIKAHVKNNVFQPLIDTLQRLLEHIEVLQMQDGETEASPANHDLDALAATFIQILPEFVAWITRNVEQPNIPVHALKQLVFFKEQLVVLEDMCREAGILEEEEEVEPVKVVAKKGDKKGDKKTGKGAEKTTEAVVAKKTKKIEDVEEQPAKKAKKQVVQEEVVVTKAVAKEVTKEATKATTKVATNKPVKANKIAPHESGVISKKNSVVGVTTSDIPLPVKKKRQVAAYGKSKPGK